MLVMITMEMVLKGRILMKVEMVLKDGNDRPLFDMNGGVLDGVLDGEEENGDSFEDFLIL